VVAKHGTELAAAASRKPSAAVSAPSATWWATASSTSGVAFTTACVRLACSHGGHPPLALQPSSSASCPVAQLGLMPFRPLVAAHLAGRVIGFVRRLADRPILEFVEVYYQFGGDVTQFQWLQPRRLPQSLLHLLIAVSSARRRSTMASKVGGSPMNIPAPIMRWKSSRNAASAVSSGISLSCPARHAS